MRSICVQLIILLISFAPAKAQPQVSVSDPFEEPTWGWDKILQLENGNTFYFHYADGEMKVSVYGKDHKLKSTREIDGRGWKASRKWKTIINALYDIKGEPVVFLTQQENRAPSLFRLRFNPENGLVKEEKLLFTLDNMVPVPVMQ
ncbi:MAG TPA: hypothetical protein VEB40_10300 [Flavipsychrobacter sp.]|nr:hypothetical protein [Flavipsychrobacter sp.]